MKFTLYHGTTKESAETFLTSGWQPSSGQAGANQGQRRLLYLTDTPENAMWFAEQNGGDVVLTVEIDAQSLVVDPEDGIGTTIEEEIEIASRNGFPANFAARCEIPPEAFNHHDNANKPNI